MTRVFSSIKYILFILFASLSTSSHAKLSESDLLHSKNSFSHRSAVIAGVNAGSLCLSNTFVPDTDCGYIAYKVVIDNGGLPSQAERVENEVDRRASYISHRHHRRSFPPPPPIAPRKNPTDGMVTAAQSIALVLNVSFILLAPIMMYLVRRYRRHRDNTRSAAILGIDAIIGRPSPPRSGENTERLRHRSQFAAPLPIHSAELSYSSNMVWFRGRRISSLRYKQNRERRHWEGFQITQAIYDQLSFSEVSWAKQLRNAQVILCMICLLLDLFLIYLQWMRLNGSIKPGKKPEANSNSENRENLIYVTNTLLNLSAISSLFAWSICLYWIHSDLKRQVLHRSTPVVLFWSLTAVQSIVMMLAIFRLLKNVEIPPSNFPMDNSAVVPSQDRGDISPHVVIMLLCSMLYSVFCVSLSWTTRPARIFLRWLNIFKKLQKLKQYLYKRFGWKYDSTRMEAEGKEEVQEEPNVIREAIASTSEEEKENGEEMENIQNFGSEKQFNPKHSSNLRWLILALVALSMFAHWYCYDIPTAVSTFFMSDADGDPGLSASQFVSLYSAYSYPNLIVPLFGGLLVDRIGLKTTLITFSFITFVGNVMIALGVSEASYILMMIAQVINGIGGESFAVACNTILSDWFDPRQLPLAMGLKSLIGLLGTVGVDWVAVKIAQIGTLETTMWVGACLAGGAWVASVCIAIVHSRGVARKEENVEEGENENEGESQRVEMVERDREGCDTEVVNLSDILRFPSSMWFIAIVAISFSSCLGTTYNILSDFLCTKYMADYFTVEEYKGLGTSKLIFFSFQKRFINFPFKSNHFPCAAVEQVSFLMMVPFTIAAFLSPLLGFAVGKYGGRMTLLCISCTLMVFTEFFFLLAPGVEYTGQFAPNNGTNSSYNITTLLGNSTNTNDLFNTENFEPDCLSLPGVQWYLHPIWALIFLGFSYCTYNAAIWSSLVFIVPSESLGTAFGFVTVSQNVGLGLMPQAIGPLISSNEEDPTENDAGYEGAFVVLCVSSVVALVTSLFLRFRKESKILNAIDPNKRKTEKESALDTPLLLN
eukprot:g4941.t1